MTREHWTTRLSVTEATLLRNYMEKHDLSKSDALREMVRDGLGANGLLQLEADGSGRRFVTAPILKYIGKVYAALMLITYLAVSVNITLPGVNLRVLMWSAAYLTVAIALVLHTDYPEAVDYHARRIRALAVERTSAAWRRVSNVR